MMPNSSCFHAMQPAAWLRDDGSMQTCIVRPCSCSHRDEMRIPSCVALVSLCMKQAALSGGMPSVYKSGRFGWLYDICRDTDQAMAQRHMRTACKGAMRFLEIYMILDQHLSRIRIILLRQGEDSKLHRATKASINETCFGI